MPIKPKPFTLICPKCYWQKSFVPRSDVLIKPFPEQCPKCGHKELERKEYSRFSLAGLFGESC